MSLNNLTNQTTGRDLMNFFIIFSFLFSMQASAEYNPTPQELVNTFENADQLSDEGRVNLADLYDAYSVDTSSNIITQEIGFSVHNNGDNRRVWERYTVQTLDTKYFQKDWVIGHFYFWPFILKLSNGHPAKYLVEELKDGYLTYLADEYGVALLFYMKPYVKWARNDDGDFVSLKTKGSGTIIRQCRPNQNCEYALKVGSKYTVFKKRLDVCDWMPKHFKHPDSSVCD